MDDRRTTDYCVASDASQISCVRNRYSLADSGYDQSSGKRWQLELAAIAEMVLSLKRASSRFAFLPKITQVSRFGRLQSMLIFSILNRPCFSEVNNSLFRVFLS